MLSLLTIFPVILGIGLLLGGLVSVRRLIAMLPAGPIRRNWHLLSGLIVLFAVGYTIFAVSSAGRADAVADWIVPGIFLLGAVFVYLTVRLSLRTAADIRRIALLESENVTDHLLGIFNRRYMDRRLQEEWDRARRYDLPLSVLIIDIDHFKRVNDVYGHAVGDLVLANVAKLVQQSVRESDIAARYGGEELVIIAVNTPLQAVGVLAERIRERIANQGVAVSVERIAAQPIRITVSIGGAALGSNVADAQALLQAADKAMYRAKEDGRDRVVLHADTDPEQPPRELAGISEP